jgi:hypothetical protein
MFSLNNRIFTAQYKKQELKARTVGGFAVMSHKNALFPLEVLVDAKLSDGSVILAGSIAYVKEETLFLRTSAGSNGGPAIPVYTNEEICSEPFHILDLGQIEMVNPKE